MTSAKLDLAMEMMTAEKLVRGEPEKQSLPNEGWDLPALLSIPNHTHTNTHPPFLLCPPIAFSLHPLTSSLSSEPLPLRSDRGQHFSILQHTMCTHTDALTHHKHTYIRMLQYKLN